MTPENSESKDVLGIRPFGDSLKIITQGVVDGASAFLSRICLPAAEELGLLLKDKLSAWRAKNTINILQMAEKIAKQTHSTEVYAPPKLVFKAIEEGSWTEDSEIQKMWAGLLSSSCTRDGKDEGNLVFMNILSQLTNSEVKILNLACEKSKKRVSRGGWIYSKKMFLNLCELQELSNLDDEQQIDRELDHLHSLSLISGGFKADSKIADVSPTALALNMYVRAQGFLYAPIKYFESVLQHDPQTEVVEIIIEEFKSKPILKRKETIAIYKGKTIIFNGVLSNLSEWLYTPESKDIQISLNPLGSYYTVRGKINLKDYPELESARGGELYEMKGAIKDIDSISIELSDIQIKYIIEKEN
ncbi:MAG: Abi-alpha family protein [Phycisphaerales bacterium]